MDIPLDLGAAAPISSTSSCGRNRVEKSTVPVVYSHSFCWLRRLRCDPAIAAFDIGSKRLRSDAAQVAVRHRRVGANTSTFFTIGHSTRTIAAFVDLLRESRVDFVVDVRSMPRSRTNPQFNGESLPETLTPWQIGYEHLAELGGHRGKARNVEASLNAYWRVRGFRNYADYALTKPFAAGLARLREMGTRHRCAIMCAEAVWWRCHRRIIADYLLSEGECVLHILGTAHVDDARLTPGAAVRGDGTIIYPAQDSRTGSKR